MRIDLPSCSFKYCRYNSGCNCTDKNKREYCEFERYKSGSERMIPKKPIITESCAGCEKETCTGCLSDYYSPDTKLCPNCKEVVNYLEDADAYTDNYCSNCGQALDWSSNDK